jgi:ATP-dependent DNA ligase
VNDLRFLPLQDRKQRLRGAIRDNCDSLLDCDHVDLAGEEFFHLACEGDLEGIVAKRRYDPYLVERAA